MPGTWGTDLDGAGTRLAAYGTLRPGQVNHHLLDDLNGTWVSGTVRGVLVPVRLGRHTGLIGLILDEGAAAVPVEVFTSPDLPAHWPRLDDFEGPAFPRTQVEVATADGPVLASIYVLSQ